MNETVECNSCAGATRAADTRSGRRLEYFTLGWNVTEATVAITAGIVAGSIALVGFGTDSVIESLSSLVLLWRLQSPEADERRERQALRLVGVCFPILAAYVTFEAVHALRRREVPEASYVGIGLSVVSLIVMPLLARAKRRVRLVVGRSRGGPDHGRPSSSTKACRLCAESGVMIVTNANETRRLHLPT